jgi:flavodoxin
MDNYYLSSAMNKFIFEGKKVSLFEISEQSYYRFATENEALDARERLRNNNFG